MAQKLSVPRAPLPTGGKPGGIAKPSSQGDFPINRPGLVGATTGKGPEVTSGQGSIAPPGAKPSFETAIPGVSGVTPGAVERRLGGRASVPPSTQLSGSMAPRGFSPTQQMLSLGNTVGANPRAISDPIALIQQLLRQLQ